MIASWDAIQQKRVDQIEWDIFLLPLLFGPLSILDNMLFDNRGLIQAVQKPEIENLLRLYAERGLFTLWHRDRYSDGRYPVLSMEDLPMIWLTRTGMEANRTVAFASLSDEDNRELRRLIRSFGEHTSRSARLREFCSFMNLHVQGFDDAVKIYERIFFGSAQPATLTWARFPEPIQFRILSALGVPNPALVVQRCLAEHGSIHRALEAELPARELPNLPGLNWQEFLFAAREDGAERDFLERLATTGDPGRTNLARAAQSVMQGQPEYSQGLGNLVNAAYVGGIPEANGEHILWPWTVESEKKEKDEKIDTTEDRRALALKIAASLDQLAPSVLKATQALERVDQTKARKQLKRHLGLLQDIIFKDDIAKPSDEFKSLARVAGAGAISALTFAILPDTQHIVLNNPTLLAIFELATADASQKLLSIVYPRFLGRKGMYGVHSGAFYKKGCRLVDLISYKR